MAATVRSRVARAVTAAAVALASAGVLVGGGAPATAAPVTPIATWGTATIDLPNGAVAYDETRDQVLVAVAPSVPTLGNHLVEVNPHNGTIGRAVPVGADPRAIAVAHDGTRAYVGGVGSSYVTEVDLETYTVVRQIFLGNHSIQGGRYVDDIEVHPTDASVIAVSRQYEGRIPRHAGVAIYDDGVQREVTSPAHTGPDRITWDADDPSTIYGYDVTSSAHEFYVLTVDAEGVTYVEHDDVLDELDLDIEYAEGAIVATDGTVIDPNTLTTVGSYTADGPFAVDIGTNTAFFLDGTTLSSHSTDTRLPTGSRTVPAISPTALIETTGTLVASSSTKIMMLGPDVSVAGFALPAAPESRLRTWGAVCVPVAVEQLASSPDGQKLYGVVRQSASSWAGRVVEISTATGAITRSREVGVDPHRIAVSGDGSTLMVGHLGDTMLTELNAANLQIRRTIDLPSGEWAADIDGQPGSATAFAVVVAAQSGSPLLEGQLMVEGGAILPNRGPGHTGVTSGTFAGDPERYHGVNGGTSDFGFYTLQVDESGLTPLSVAKGISRDFEAEVSAVEGIVYSNLGQVFDPLVPSVIGDVPAGQIAPFPAAGRLFSVAGSTIRELDSETLGAVADRTFAGTVRDAIPAGSHLAIATTGGAVLIIPVGDPQPAVGALSPTTGEPTGGNTVTITGAGLRGATAVRFGTTAATSFTVVDDTTITAVAPPHAEGAVDVTVTTPGGTSDIGSASTYTYAWPGRSPSESWVFAAYEDFLDREPTDDELAAAVARLESGTPRSTIARELATSPEWIAHLVTAFYTDTLDREPTSDELAYWAEELATGRRTVAQVAASFYASSEYFTGVGGTNADWIEDLYLTLLGREASSGDVAYWSGQVSARGRGWVALQLFQSLESRRARVTVLYEALLGRAPDAAGRDYWAGRLTREGDIALARNLASSAEYLARARTRFP